jgi:hypothetical protein
MRQKHNIHRILCNFVAANGPQRWSDLHQLVLMIAGRNLNEEHWGISYLDNVSSNSVLFPKEHDSRYLFKGDDGLYHISNENNTND